MDSQVEMLRTGLGELMIMNIISLTSLSHEALCIILLERNSPEMEISGKKIIKLSSHFHNVDILPPGEMISNYFEGRGFQKLVGIRETKKAC